MSAIEETEREMNEAFGKYIEAKRALAEAEHQYSARCDLLADAHKHGRTEEYKQWEEEMNYFGRLAFEAEEAERVAWDTYDFLWFDLETLQYKQHLAGQANSAVSPAA